MNGEKVNHAMWWVIFVAVMLLIVGFIGYIVDGTSGASERAAKEKQEYMDSCTGVTAKNLLAAPSTYLYQKVRIKGTVISYGRSKTDSSDVVMEIFPIGTNDEDDRIYALMTVSSSTLTGVEAGDEITLYGIYVGNEDYNIDGGFYSSATLKNMFGSDSPNIEVKYFTYTSN